MLPHTDRSHMNRSTLAALAIGAAIASIGFFAGNAEARRPVILAAPPTAVGTVNMAVVFDKLAEAAEWDVKIKGLEARVGEELKARKRELEDLSKEVKDMPEGAAKEAKIDSARLKQLQAEQWGVMKELELDRERSLKWQAVYRSVREGAAKLAESEKYDLIVIDDSKIEIQVQRDKNAPPLEAQAKGQISQLRVLYAGRMLDVTEKLVVQINNAHTANMAPAAATPKR